MSESRTFQNIETPMIDATPVMTGYPFLNHEEIIDWQITQPIKSCVLSQINSSGNQPGDVKQLP